MCEVQMLCCWILLHKNNEFLMYLVNSSEAKLITLWWLPLLTLLWTTQNYLWYYPLYCNACCTTTTTIPWNQDLENKPEISPDPPLYIIKSDEKKLLFFCIPISVVNWTEARFGIRFGSARFGSVWFFQENRTKYL